MEVKNDKIALFLAPHIPETILNLKKIQELISGKITLQEISTDLRNIMMLRMKALITFEWLIKLVLRFDLKKWRNWDSRIFHESFSDSFLEFDKRKGIDFQDIWNMKVLFIGCKGGVWYVLSQVWLSSEGNGWQQHNKSDS